MNKLNKAILIALGMSLPLSVMASPDDDVTIRMMQANEHAGESVTSHIELPETAAHHAREHAANGLDMANNNRNGDHHGEKERDKDRDHEIEREDEHERERDMEREEEHDRERDMERADERERDMERDDRKDVEHGGRDREEVERDDRDIDHDRDSRPEIESPETPEAPEHGGDSSSHDH